MESIIKQQQMAMNTGYKKNDLTFSDICNYPDAEFARGVPKMN
jgi:hypothetical protein